MALCNWARLLLHPEDVDRVLLQTLAMADGRDKEAPVPADLLNDVEVALTLLEDRGLVEFAARLAETRWSACEQASIHSEREQAHRLGVSNRHGTKRFQLTIPARAFGPGAEFVPVAETVLDHGPPRPHMNGGMAAFSIRTSLGVVVVVLNLARMQVAMRVYLPQARSAALRLRAPQDLCVADDLGRVAIIDCARRILRNTFEVT